MTSYASELPTVDLSAFPNDSHGLGQAIGAGMEKAGLVYLTNTGFDQQLITELWDCATSFFTLPTEVKSKYRMELPPVEGSSGYSGFNQTHGVGETEDAKENLMETDQEAFNYFPFLNNMRWPDDQVAPGFITKYRAFCDGTLQLSWTILDSLSLYWKKDPGIMRSAFCGRLLGDCSNENWSAGRLNYYVPLTGHEKEGATRLIAHRDYDIFTLLWPRGPGLQVLQDGDWTDVSLPPPGGLLLQAGAAIEIITDNKIHASMHRVVVPPGGTEVERRTSTVFFFAPDYQCPMVPLDGNPKGAETFQEFAQKQFGGKY